MTRPADLSSPHPSAELVVVLHGVAISRWFTARLARFIGEAGYAVVNVTYPSRTQTIATLGETWLPQLLREHRAGQAAKLHFVTHSMGGLVLRHFLAREHPANLGRVVMIVPPNHGSVVSDKLRHNRFVQHCIGINLPALGTQPDAFFRALPPRADFDLGVIAGSFALNPAGRFWLERPNDGTVAVANTRLEGMRDHLVLPSNHTVILFRRRTAAQVVAFLQNGRFARSQ